VSADWLADWTVVDHMTAPQLLGDLDHAANDERRSTAYVLPRIAEVDRRKLYASAGFSSMYAFCTGRLRYSDDAASRRIQAARKAREIPALFIALADGRLNLTAICVLSPHITAENADELIAAATHRHKWEIKHWLRKRFAHPDLLTALATGAKASAHAPAHTEASSGGPEAVPAASEIGSEVGSENPQPIQAPHAPAHIVESADGADGAQSPASSNPAEPSLARAAQSTFLDPAPHAPAHVPAAPSWAPSSEWETITLPIKGWKLRYARELMSHALPSRSAALIYDRSIDLLIRQQEKQKFGLTTAHRASRLGSPRFSLNPRSLPAHLRRAVWERDHGRCTFVANDGTRCESRDYLEYDHIDPVARGGKATVDRIRLRCRGHNQYEAEQVFGAAFMERKREQARRWRAEKKRDRRA